MSHGTGRMLSRLVLPSPLAPVMSAWRNRSLVARLARREIEARYRGSLLGVAWALVTPLVMLAVYTFVFSVVFRARWGAESDRTGEFGLVLFSGLLTYNLFADCVNRAPGLIIENGSYVKKVVFPLETLAWVVLLGALFSTGVSVLILLVAVVALGGTPPLTAMLFPVLVVPLCLLTLGAIWFLSSIGVFVRDIRQVVPVITTALLFLSPIFFPAEAVPEGFRFLVRLNPATPTIESARDVLVFGRSPDWPAWAVSLAVSAVGCWAGFTWFANTRKGFADVL